MNTISRFFLCGLLFATMLLVGCGDDPKPTNEEELITSFSLTLSSAGNADVIIEWNDDNENGVVDLSEKSVSGNLLAETVYAAQIELASLDESITEEIIEEAADHLFCFTVSGSLDLTVEYADSESDYIAGGSEVVPVGLASTWTTNAASTGEITIVLRHQPGTKTGDCPGSGDTDISISFDLVIE